jgi:hypothetical protein
MFALSPERSDSVLFFLKIDALIYFFPVDPGGGFNLLNNISYTAMQVTTHTKSSIFWFESFWMYCTCTYCTILYRLVRRLGTGSFNESGSFTETDGY